MQKSGARETKWLLFVIMISHICLSAVGELTMRMASGAVFGFGISALVAIVILFLTELCLGNMGHTDIKSALGNRGYIILSVILFVITLFNAARRMKEFSTAIGSTVLPESPAVFILLIMSASAFAAGLIGMEAITRYALISAGVFFVFIAALFLANIPRADLINIYPLGGKNGFPDPFAGLYIFSDAVYLFFIQHRVKNYKANKFLVSKTVIPVALAGIAITLFYCLCVPYPASVMYRYPLYRLSLLANTSVVFQRLDGLVYLIWIFFSFVCQGALVIFATDIISNALELKNKKALIASVTLICFLISLMNTDFADFVRGGAVIFAFVLFPACVLLLFKKGRKINE